MLSQYVLNRTPDTELPRRNPRRLGVLSGRVCQGADLILLSCAMMGDVSSLHPPLSVRNVLVAVMCISTWRVIRVSVGVYPAIVGSARDYIFRYLIALNSCTAVVGLIDVLLRPARDVWHTVGVFWLLALGMTGALRILLLSTRRARGAS